MKTTNIWKAWGSTLIGLFIPILTTIGTDIANGKVDWHAVGLSCGATLVLAVTDLLKEAKGSLNDQADNQ